MCGKEGNSQSSTRAQARGRVHKKGREAHLSLSSCTETHLKEQLRPAFVWCLIWVLMIPENWNWLLRHINQETTFQSPACPRLREVTVFQSSKFLNKDITRGAHHCFSQTYYITYVPFYLSIEWAIFCFLFPLGLSAVLKGRLSGRVAILHVCFIVWFESP